MGVDRSYGRRIGDAWDAAPRRALVALSDPLSAGRLAKSFADRRIVSTLIFSCEPLVRESGRSVYGLIVLDHRLECSHDGRCIRELTQTSATPVIYIGEAEKGGSADINLGSDFNTVDIVDRGTALIELSRPVRLPSSLRYGPLELDVARHQAYWDRRPISLTALQFRIMEVLVIAAGSVVTTAELSRRVWGSSGVADDDRLFAHVRRIRRLIEPDPAQPVFLLRIRGRGFRLADEPG